MLAGKNLIAPSDFTVEQLETLFQLTDDIVTNPEKYARSCVGKLLATMFFEPSTRTRLSFEAAMERLGGKVLGFSDPASSSVSKGESIADTIRMMSCYADIAVIRHPYEGAAHVAALHSFIPVINAGDGGHQHPTQTLTDLYTIRAKKGGFDNLTVGLCGDLKYGRTVHSLVNAMIRYNNVRFVFISPEELKVPDYVIREIENSPSCSYTTCVDLDEAIRSGLDILYMTRIQRERFPAMEEYERLKGCYILDADKMSRAGENLIVLHPMPIVNEITGAVDEDPRACYFVQAQYGMYVRMALILTLLGGEHGYPTVGGARMFEKTCVNPRPTGKIPCPNPRCVTHLDPTLPIRTKNGGANCEYCDAKIVE